MPELDAQSPGLSETETGRLEAFCDGVFAIAITLLVLEIRVPSVEKVHGTGALLRALVHLWPSYLGYIISFVTIGIMWTNHHSIFTYVRRSDRYFLLINVLFLMCISFLPFPTAVRRRHGCGADHRPPLCPRAAGLGGLVRPRLRERRRQPRGARGARGPVPAARAQAAADRPAAFSSG